MRMKSNLAGQGLGYLCEWLWCVVNLNEQTSNQVFEILQGWEADLQEACDLLKSPP